MDAPLAFAQDGGPLARAVRLVSHASAVRAIAGRPEPGCVLIALSLGASPDAVQVQPLLDLAASLPDPLAVAVYMHATCM